MKLSLLKLFVGFLLILSPKTTLAEVGLNCLNGEDPTQRACGINNTSSCPPNMICNGQNKCECEKGKSFSRTKCSCLIAAGGKGCDVSKDCVDGAFCIQGHDHDHIHCDHHHHGFFISHTHCGHEYEAMTRSRCDCCKGSIGGNRDGNCPPLDANGNCPNGGQRKIISKWMIWGLAIVSIYLASNLVVQ